MNHLFRGCLLVLAMGLLASCATLSEEECRYADWYSIGMSDGRDGRPDSRLAKHAKACEEHGVRPDAESWRAGWREGITRYCSASSGWREGLSGTSYGGVCPPAQEGEFLSGYELGPVAKRGRGIDINDMPDPRPRQIPRGGCRFAAIGMGDQIHIVQIVFLNNV